MNALAVPNRPPESQIPAAAQRRLEGESARRMREEIRTRTRTPTLESLEGGWDVGSALERFLGWVSMEGYRVSVSEQGWRLSVDG